MTITIVHKGTNKGSTKMGLACSNIRLLTLTARKADCETGLSIDSMRKLALSREQSSLSKEYNSRLRQKTISYYDNGKYNKINYQYLMGYSDYTAITSGNRPLKNENSMVLTDYKGQVVMSDQYAAAITKVLGNSAMSPEGRGGTFSLERIPEIIAALVPGHSAEEFATIIDGNSLESNYNTDNVQSITGKENGNSNNVDNSEEKSSILEKIVDFYYPIFLSAAANGWTKEYNKDMNLNDNYIADAISSGAFQLAKVDDTGNYEPDMSLTYFVTANLVEARNDSDVREDLKAWYDAERERISAKEDYIDIDMDELSTELEAIKIEMQSVQSMIDDAISSVFDWGNG